MSSIKIPNQFPWVVAAVVVAHGIVAIFLFGGTGEAIRQPRAATPDITTLEVDPEKPSPSAVSHPLGKTGSAAPVTSSEAVPVKAETFGQADNANFEPRFPKRIPRQSELNAAVAAVDGPVTAEDIFKVAQAEKLKTESATEPETEKKGSAAFALPSAVAVAKAAPFSKIDTADSATTTAEDSQHRLRMVERTNPVAGPRAISTKPEVVRPEPISETTPEPKLRFKTSLPSVSKIKPIERNPVSQPRVVSTPPAAVAPPVAAPPAEPSNKRKFRVVKPLPR